MRLKAVLLLCSFFVLASCASGPGAEFPIAGGPLRPEELAINSFGQTPLVARVFDVVNQDLSADKNTGLANRVQPMPVDILSAYSAGKFRANGGPYIVRFVIRQAAFQVRTVSGGDGGWFGGDNAKAELSLDLSVMVTASQPNGTGATITATTTQSQQAPFATPEENRRVYMALMMRALQAVDSEISRQLPTYFNGVVAR